MQRPYRPIAFANEFIVLAQPDGAEHMKLQKLVYYAYGWWLKYHPDRIISEAPEVWQFGPVFPSLYHALKYQGRAPILDVQTETPFDPPPRVDEDDIDAHKLVKFVWVRYGQFDSLVLSDRTHAPGTAWREIAEKNGWKVPANTPIPDDAVKREMDREAQKFRLT
jgi:uncharacterized phage-associated protein